MRFTPIRGLKARSSQIAVNTLVSVLGGIGFTLVGAAYVSQQILNPVRKMKGMLQQLQEGTLDWNARLQAPAADEISDLVRWFNASLDMLGAKEEADAEIRSLNAELECRVRERTAELETTNAALQTEIGERVQAEQQIRESLAEKEVLLREINHRVKNNLQVITSMLHLQSSRLADTRAADALLESQNRVRSMALIHQRLYRSDDLAAIDFGAYLRDLTTTLAKTYSFRPDCVEWQVAASDIQLGLDMAVPCGLIVNELVSNALKYAFPENECGSIIIQMVQDGDMIVLDVSDTGVGLPPELDLERTSTLGLKLVSTLVHQLDGTLEVINGAGAHFRVRFPCHGKRER